MTTATVDYVAYTPDTTTLRAWGAAVSGGFDAITEVELVYSNVNWTTITSPGTGTGVSYGYEVYRFTDTLQASVPVFFSVVYGSDTGLSYAEPSISIIVGSSYSGSGPLTGHVTLTCYAANSQLGSTSTRTLYLSSDGHGIAISYGHAFFYRGGQFVIDRFRSSLGAPLAAGWAALGGRAGYSKTCFYDSASDTASVKSLNARWPAVGIVGLTGSSTTYDVQGNANILTNWGSTRNGTYPLKMSLTYYYNDFPPTPGNFDIDFLGTTRNYKRTGLGQYLVSGSGSGYSHTYYNGACLAIWWGD